MLSCEGFTHPSAVMIELHFILTWYEQINLSYMKMVATLASKALRLQTKARVSE